MSGEKYMILMPRKKLWCLIKNVWFYCLKGGCKGLRGGWRRGWHRRKEKGEKICLRRSKQKRDTERKQKTHGVLHFCNYSLLISLLWLKTQTNQQRDEFPPVKYHLHTLYTAGNKKENKGCCLRNGPRVLQIKGHTIHIRRLFVKDGRSIRVWGKETREGKKSRSLYYSGSLTEALALLCVSYQFCWRETHGSLSDLLNISLCFLKMATQCFCFSRSVCVNIYVCVSLRGKCGSGSLQEELDSVWVGGWRRRWRPGPGTCTLILPAHVCTSSSRGDVYSRELEGVQNLNVGCY